MMTRHFPAREASPRILATFGSLLFSSLLVACGGGGSGTSSPQQSSANPPPPVSPGTNPNNPPGSANLPAPLDPSVPMTMACIDGVGYQCSGDTVLRIDHGIALTRSGVQAYGRSTSDLATPITDVTTATGLMLASGGMSEIRLARNGSNLSGLTLILRQLGLRWDGVNERPPIIETFNPTAGRISLAGNGALLATTLPPSSDLGFYDYASKGPAATQDHYANNRYFPRSPSDVRCPAGMTCRTTETDGPQMQAGNWNSGGTTPDAIAAVRLHGDGDIHAGNGEPDALGNPTILPGGDGFGVPYPGSKGYRSYDGWSYTYANLAAWMTQDTVDIVEWTPGSVEHNTNRRGMAAFGDVSDPATIPASGTASYSGLARGWYAANGTDEAQPFFATIKVIADFAARQVSVTLQQPVNLNTNAALPFAFTTAVGMGASGLSVANYLSGTVQVDTLNGGLGGRFFGPVTGGVPPEIGGTFSLSNTGGRVVLGGFIARQQ